MIFTQNATPLLKMQNYKAYNRGDMYVPNTFVSSPLRVAALATPYVGHRPVHSVPVSYSNVKSQLIGARGMATPVKAVLANGS
jgi:hypothetical protein